MSVEYLKAKKEALEQLVSTCVSNLRKLQENGVQVEFSFRDQWGWMKQDSSTHPQVPVLNQLSRIFTNFDVKTWVDYSYKNGQMSAEQFQELRNGMITESVQVHDEIVIEDIPFDKFSEGDLFRAAKAMEAHLEPTPVQA